MTDYSTHRLNDDSELLPYMEDMPRYISFVNRVYNLLNSLEIGEGLSVDKVVKPENLDVFIKVVCCYILHENPFRPDSYIEFNTEYTIITRVPAFQMPHRYQNLFHEK